jgi:Fe2+ or Zn2+ uptake regulation protein
MSFFTAIVEDRRLSLLLVLQQTPGYSTNAFLLRDAVDQIYGHSASLDQVKNDIAWLAEQGLVESRSTGDVVLAKLTARGVDVADGRATVHGVKKPMP